MPMWSIWLAPMLLFSGANSCSSELTPDGQASCLLQVTTGKLAAASKAPLTEVHASAGESWLKLPRVSSSASATKQPKQPAFSPGQSGQARAILSPSLFHLGMKVLGDESTLDAVVANTNYHNVTYSGEKLYMRLVNEGRHDGACTDCNFGTTDPDVYGLNFLRNLEPDEHGMLTMLDVGGNYGAVTVAAFKKYPNRLRIITVEPVPSTYFLLEWNLRLNGVPQFEEKDFRARPTVPGVLALNNGVASANEKVLGLCYTPPFTMNAKVCTCAAQSAEVSQQLGVEQCANVVSTTLQSLVGRFHSGATHLSFLKVDCEGCELDLLPALDALAEKPLWKLGRLAGELHGADNSLEDIACKFGGGKWLENICDMGPNVEPSAKLIDRCGLGPTRTPCGALRMEGGQLKK